MNSTSTAVSADGYQTEVGGLAHLCTHLRSLLPSVDQMICDFLGWSLYHWWEWKTENKGIYFTGTILLIYVCVCVGGLGSKLSFASQFATHPAIHPPTCWSVYWCLGKLGEGENANLDCMLACVPSSFIFFFIIWYGFQTLRKNHGMNWWWRVLPYKRKGQTREYWRGGIAADDFGINRMSRVRQSWHTAQSKGGDSDMGCWKVVIEHRVGTGESVAEATAAAR